MGEIRGKIDKWEKKWTKCSLFSVNHLKFLKKRRLNKRNVREKLIRWEKWKKKTKKWEKKSQNEWNVRGKEQKEKTGQHLLKLMIKYTLKPLKNDEKVKWDD